METLIIIGIILILTFILIFIIYHNTSSKYYGLCPKCHKEFKPTTKQLIFTIHAFDDFSLTCPHCGYHGMMPLKKNKL